MLHKAIPVVAGILIAQHIAPKVTAQLPASVPDAAKSAIAIVIGGLGGVLVGKYVG